MSDPPGLLAAAPFVPSVFLPDRSNRSKLSYGGVHNRGKKRNLRFPRSADSPPHLSKLPMWSPEAPDCHVC
jgi:hypothetical protein